MFPMLRGSTPCLLALLALACGSSSPKGDPMIDMTSPPGGGSGGSGSTAMPQPSANGGTGASEGLGTGASEGLGTGGGVTLAGSGGEPSTTPMPSGDDFVRDITVSVHPEVNTILVVTWTQEVAAESTWLEFTFEDGNVLRSRARPATAGEHRDVALGIPGQTDVTLRIVNLQGGAEYKSRDFSGRTAAVPSGPNGFPTPTLVAYDAALASPERWMLGSVENSEGGCGPQCYNQWTYWTYIMDRKGRIVWYYADPASNATSSFQRLAKDGEYIWIEKRPYGRPGPRAVLKLTLDHSYSEEIAVANLADSIDVTDTGSLLYDANNELRELVRGSTTPRTIWSCRTQFGQGFSCYTNTINWHKETDSVWMSYPEENTVVEVNRQTGQLVATYGDRAGSYSFSPATWQFEFQHFPNVTPQGTLLVSSHMPGFEDTYEPVAGQHAFVEFEIDRQNRRLVERWSYNAGQEWAMYKGMAIRVSKGNTLANYGSGGVIREITPSGETAFEIKFASSRKSVGEPIGLG